MYSAKPPQTRAQQASHSRILPSKPREIIHKGFSEPIRTSISCCSMLVRVAASVEDASGITARMRGGT